jgi:1-acyl-sn-glycerol-3-phosphate acyltransferase
MFFKPGDPKNAQFPAWCLRKMFSKYKIIGKINKNNKTGRVVIINHQSVYDLIVLAELWPLLDNNACVISKRTLWLWCPPFALAAYLWGTIFIDRTKPHDAMSALRRQMEAIQSKGRSVIIFPEGTRSSRLLPFKRGAFKLAEEAECPILPVIVKKNQIILLNEDFYTLDQAHSLYVDYLK